MKYIYLSVLLLFVGFSSFAAAAISGTMSVCAGSATTLTDTTLGGTWYSLDPSVATVNPSTGVVSGVSAGTVMISYDLGLGGADTAVVTVYAMPSAIAGITPVCSGSTISLSSTPSGGTWSLSPTSVATINDTDGVVSGIVSGTAIASYTLTGGCSVTGIINVDPLPGGVTGMGIICIGSSTTLTDATGSGSWSSSDPSTAFIDATSGLVLGSTAGFATISYTLPTGCGVSFLMNVVSSPAPIAGLPAGDLCTGTSITFSDATAGGSWSSGDTTLAKADSATGVITSVGAGFNIITYSLGIGCSVSTIVTIDPAPTAIIGDSMAICTSSPVILLDTTTGGTWSGSSAVATVDTATGLVTGLTAGTATISYTIGVCSVTTTVTIDAAPCNTGVSTTTTASTTPELFPNPATDELTIKTAGNYSSFTITNGMGQVVAQQQIATKETTLNVNTLAPALYYITFKGEQGTLVQRFIKL